MDNSKLKQIKEAAEIALEFVARVERLQKENGHLRAMLYGEKNICPKRQIDLPCWLEVAVDRYHAGEPEEEVLADYGYYRKEKQP